MHKQEIIDKLLNRIFTLEGYRENAVKRPSADSVTVLISVKRVNKKKRSKQKDQFTQGDPNTYTDKQVGKTPKLVGQDASRSGNKDSSNQVVILGESIIKNIQGWRLKRE